MDNPKTVQVAMPAARQEILRIATEVLQIEAEGIQHLIDNLSESFADAVELICSSKGRVVVTGIGKSGIVGRKIVATLSSTGTPAFFIHPVEAMHGDLGMVRGEDVVLAISNSGETDELNAILPSMRVVGARLIALTGNLSSSLARFCDIAIYTGVEREACPLGLAPTSSTTAQLAMGDAIAVALIKLHDFRVQDFRRIHPGGHLGDRLKAPVSELMRKGEDIPIVEETATVPIALDMMNCKGVGATLVVNGESRLMGIFTDGDLRRAMNKHGDPRGFSVQEVMTTRPRTISTSMSVAEALEVMEKYLITVLPVASPSGKLEGILHLHDLLGKGKIRFTG